MAIANSELGVDFIRVFRKLMTAGGRLATAVELDDHAHACWVPLSRSEKDNKALSERHVAALAMTTVFYELHQDEKRTAQRPGLVGASSRTLQRAHKFNEVKWEFREVMQAIAGESATRRQIEVARNRAQGKIMDFIAGARDPLYEEILRRAGKASLNLMQCYRQVPIIEPAPYSVGFRLVQNVNAERICRDDLLAEMEKRGILGHDVGMAVNLLSKMRRNETLVVRRMHGLSYRANIRSQEGHMSSCNAHTPILVPLRVNQDLPRYTPVEYLSMRQMIKRAEQLKATDLTDKSTRMDDRLEPKPLIAFPPVYRFQVGEPERSGD